MKKKEPLNILIIEDDPSFADFLREVLGHQNEAEVAVVHVDSLAWALGELRASSFQAAVVDLTLPDSFGVGTVARIAEVVPGLPIVVLTSMEELDIAIEALRAGAQDFLYKSAVVGADLMRAIRYSIERQRVRQDLESYAARLDRQLSILHEGFEQLARGELDVRLVPHLDDTDQHGELSALLAAFDRTVERLRSAESFRNNYYAMVAHDLRSPVSTIFLSAASLIEERDPEKREVLAEIVFRRSKQLLEVIDALLELSALRDGQLKLNRKRVDVVEFLAPVVLMLADEARQHGQRLELEAKDDLSPICCDVPKLHRVIQNLVRNSIKFCREGNRIRLTVSNGNGGHRLCVQDTGPGVAPEYRERVFDPFFRGDEGAHRPGAGLGLAICKAIVQAHGGTIRLESEPGAGASFAIFVPAVETVEPPFEAESRAVGG